MIIGAAFAVCQRVGVHGHPKVSEKDCYISYLPAAHSFEQAVFGMSVITGMKSGFFAGNVLKLTDDIQILKPTLFPSVPRLYNRIYGKIKDGVKAATGVKGWLVNRAIESKLQYLKAGQGYEHKFYDKVVFKKMKATLGGNVRLMITGSAPISAEVLDFLKICFSAPICEGYGMTETCAGSCITYIDDPETGIVGGPLQNVKIRLRDIPEMGYLSSDNPPKGEICFWGPSIMKGYFKNPEKTAEAFHNDWLLSGDVGLIQPNGAIKIIDRAKNIFKLSQGEYIAPEKLENVYVQSSYVLQCWIYGDSLRDHTVGFFVMDPEKTKKYCDETGKTNDKSLMDDAEFRQAVYDDLITLANANKFNSLEKPKQITLLADPFTVESDILTPTMKLKRNIAKKMFQEQIDSMYAATVMAPSKK
jgi:long-chain acyl-CoA synthetase